VIFNQLVPILLASGSPRRQEYLARFGLEFEVDTADIDESVRSGESPMDYVRRMVLEKAEPFLEYSDRIALITADTLVLLNGEIIGKPKSQAEVLPMLELLNGRTHEVITGYGVFLGDQEVLREVTSKVHFRDNPLGMLESYALDPEPLDKAGSYSIQGLGTFLVEGIEGSFNNVVGLPIEELLEDLLRLNVIRSKH